MEILVEVRFGVEPLDLAKNEWMQLAGSYIPGLVQLIMGFVGPVEWVLACRSKRDQRQYWLDNYQYIFYDNPLLFSNFTSARRSTELLDPFEISWTDRILRSVFQYNFSLQVPTVVQESKGWPKDVSRAFDCFTKGFTATHLSLRELDADTNSEYWNRFITKGLRRRAQKYASRRKFGSLCKKEHKTYRDMFYTKELEQWVQKVRNYQSRHHLSDDDIRFIFF